MAEVFRESLRGNPGQELYGLRLGGSCRKDLTGFRWGIVSGRAMGRRLVRLESQGRIKYWFHNFYYGCELRVVSGPKNLEYQVGDGKRKIRA